MARDKRTVSHHLEYLCHGVSDFHSSYLVSRLHSMIVVRSYRTLNWEAMRCEIRYRTGVFV